MKQILQLMKKIYNPALWLSSKSQPAAYTTKQTLQDFGSCFIHTKSSRLYINLGAVIFVKNWKQQLPFLFFIIFYYYFLLIYFRGS